MTMGVARRTNRVLRMKRVPTMKMGERRPGPTRQIRTRGKATPVAEGILLRYPVWAVRSRDGNFPHDSRLTGGLPPHKPRLVAQHCGAQQRPPARA